MIFALVWRLFQSPGSSFCPRWLRFLSTPKEVSCFLSPLSSLFSPVSFLSGGLFLQYCLWSVSFLLSVSLSSSPPVSVYRDVRHLLASVFLSFVVSLSLSLSLSLFAIPYLPPVPLCLHLCLCVSISPSLCVSVCLSVFPLPLCASLVLFSFSVCLSVSRIADGVMRRKREREDERRQRETGSK